MWYNINYNKLTLLLLPTFLRKSRLTALVQSFVLPISNLYYDWKFKREWQDWYKVNHTGQVCYLCAALNDTLDPQQRRIYIDEGSSYPRTYIYQSTDIASKKWLYTATENKPMYIYQNAEYDATGADFIVKVPVELYGENGDTNEMRQLHAIVLFYKLASKRYQVVPF